jgi:hypothetical protein
MEDDPVTTEQADALIAFAKARLDEDKQRASEVLAQQASTRWWTSEWLVNLRGFSLPDAKHIEHQSPDLTLREVEAKRLVLAEHAPVESIYGLVCKRCVSWQDAPWADGGETEFGIAIPDPWPCLPVRGALSGWETHSAYRPEWGLTK